MDYGYLRLLLQPVSMVLRVFPPLPVAAVDKAAAAAAAEKRSEPFLDLPLEAVFVDDDGGTAAAAVCFWLGATLLLLRAASFRTIAEGDEDSAVAADDTALESSDGDGGGEEDEEEEEGGEKAAALAAAAAPTAAACPSSIIALSFLFFVFSFALMLSTRLFRVVGVATTARHSSRACHAAMDTTPIAVVTPLAAPPAPSLPPPPAPPAPPPLSPSSLLIPPPCPANAGVPSFPVFSALSDPLVVLVLLPSASPPLSLVPATFLTALLDRSAAAPA